MSNSYAGPTTVVADDSEIAAVAALQIHVQRDESVNDFGHVASEPGLKSWDGSLHVDDPAILWGASEATLRMPDGRTGAIRVAKIESAGRVEITGSGPAPF